MTVAGWGVLATIAIFLLLQTATIAFSLGGLFRDVKSLKEDGKGADCKAELAVLNTRLQGMEELVKELGHDIKNLLTGKVVPARRRMGED